MGPQKIYNVLLCCATWKRFALAHQDNWQRQWCYIVTASPRTNGQVVNGARMYSVSKRA